MEESKLRKELKESESKLNLKHSNNISQTQQEILQDLNLLKHDEGVDDTGKSEKVRKIMNKPNNEHHIIEEEHTYAHNETNSVIKSNTGKSNDPNSRNNDNKNQISNLSHYNKS